MKFYFILFLPEPEPGLQWSSFSPSMPTSYILPRQNKNLITLRSKIWETDYDFKIPTNKVAKNDTIPPNSYSDNCQNVKRNEGGLPLQSDYLAQIFHQIGAEFS